MPQVQRGVLTSVLGTADEGIRGSVRGFVSLGESSSVEAFVKEIDPREVLVECVCALLARQLNLEAPEPLIVLVPAELSRNGLDTLAFGSISVSHGNLRPWLAQMGDSAVMRRLRDWADLIPAACFDEWVANYDRHGGNILYDGKDKFWLIDHGMAIASGLSVDAAVENVLFGAVVTGLGEVDLLSITPKALGVMDGYVEQPVDPVFAQIPLDIWDSESQDAIGGWLRARQAHLLRLATNRIPTQQGSLLLGGGNDRA